MSLIPTLYLTRNGLLEPLGQSQVIAYLRGLSKNYQITLITFEKPEDWADSERMAEARADCIRYGIHWLPQKFHSKPKVISPVVSMARLIWLVRREVQTGGIRLIHARSYIPAAVAFTVSRMTGVPFLFDMRALWPEEMITAGRLRRGSQIHRAISASERVCLSRAAAVISLTHAALVHLKKVYPNELSRKRMVVIPTCADLERFQPSQVLRHRPIVHSCIGSVLSGWFRIDWLAAWLSTAATQDLEARFEIVTRDDPQKVRYAVDANGDLGERLTIYSRRPKDMPEAVQGHDLSVMFYAGGEVSELGRSPTRMAEVLGCGLPIVANAGVGDVARIIKEFRVGVLIDGPEPEQMSAAYLEIKLLMTDPELSKRCRAAAENIFSLEAGTLAYNNLYKEILEPM